MLKLLDRFKGMASVSIADGSTCLLWDDCWQGQSLKLAFPELFSVDSILDLFHLPLSEEAFGQFQQLEGLFQNLHMTDATDVWSYIWGNSLFSTKKTIAT
jgi:hypothetical protein